MTTPTEARDRMANLARRGRVRDAVVVGRRALELIDDDDVDWDEVRAMLGKTLRRMNRSTAAREVLRPVLGRDQVTLAVADAWMEQAVLLRASGDLSASAKAARQGVHSSCILGQTDVEVQAYQVLAETLAMAGDLDGADRSLAQALDRCDSPDSRLRVMLADARLAARVGDWERAVSASGRLIAFAEPLHVNSAMHEATTILARAAMARGTDEEASAAVRRVLPWARATGLAAAEAEVHTMLGELARRAGRLEQASHAYEQARRAYGDDGYHRYAELNLALVAIAAGRHDEALAIANRIRAPLADNAAAAILVALVGIPAAAEAGDWVAVDEALAVVRHRLELASDRDHGSTARVGAEVCERGGPAGAQRAAQLRAVALHVWAALGRRDEGDLESRALQQLRTSGAPVPLGPFLLERPIGRGAMGEVWSASHADSGKAVAVKLLIGGIASHPGARRALLRETHALAGLDHPAILAVLGHGTVKGPAAVMDRRLIEGTPWLATELATGGALTPWCGHIAWAACKRLLIQVLDALAHAHGRGLVHLDLKSGNVLLDGDPATGQPRLADFGLARALGDLGTLSRAGTPSHMAPEQHAGDVDAYGPWTDLYGLGCLAVELVSGAPPFAAMSLSQVRDAHYVQELPPLQASIALPMGFEAWVRRLLCKAPEDRFQLAADAAAALDRLGPPELPPSREPENAAELPSEKTTQMLPRPKPRSELPAWTDDYEPCPIPAPQVPMSWHRRLPEARRAALQDAGLSLLPHRRTRATGRVLERGLLWAQLRQVAGDGRARGVLLSGPPGIGRGHLSSWLAERAHEVGAARVVLVPEQCDPSEVLHLVREAATDRPVVLRVPSPAAWALVLAQDVPALCVWCADDGLEGPWPRHKDVLHVPLDPLKDEDMAGLMRSLVQLGPELLEHIVETAAGNPGIAVSMLRALAERGSLVLRVEGFALRAGAELPDVRFEEPTSTTTTTFPGL